MYKATEDGVVSFTMEELLERERTIEEMVRNAALSLSTDIRQTRNEKLRECDWTQVADVPQAIKDKFAPYRQALRDVPQQPGFPENIVWPVKP